MDIRTGTYPAMDSLVSLFAALRDDSRMNVGEGIVAIGRPEPIVPGAQYPHVKVAYERPTSAARHGRPDHKFCVHTAALRDDGELVLNSGTYDLTRYQAWAIVSGKEVK